MWAQVVGKVALALTPRSNHYWNVALAAHRARPDDARPDVRRPRVHHRVRFHRSPARHSGFGRPQRTGVAAAADGRGFLSRGRGKAARPRHRCPYLDDAGRGPGSDPFHRGHGASSLRCRCGGRFWQALLAMQPVFEAFRCRFVGKASPLHFFWGSFDLAVTRFSGRPRARAAGSRLDHARSVLARGHQPRLLARQRGGPGAGVLRVRRSGAARLQDRGRAPGGRLLQCSALGVHPALRRRPPLSIALGGPDGFSRQHLLSRGRPGALGSPGPGTELTRGRRHVQPYHRPPQGEAPAASPVRRVREDRGGVGSPAHVPDVRRRRCAATTSPNRHATEHARAAEHPVVASAEPGERWLYCYLDDVFAEY